MDYLDDGDGVDYSGHFVTDAEFGDYHDVAEWAKKISLRLGWELVISSQKRTSMVRFVVYLRCNRGERYRGKDKVLTKSTKTKACGCKFKIHVVQHIPSGIWRVEVCPRKQSMHNHPLIVYPEGHRQASSLSPAAKKHVHELRRAHTKAANIHESLRLNFPDENATRQHVYNCNSKMRADDSEGRSMMEHFIHLADEGKYQKWICFDGETHAATHIFVAHPTSINLLRTYPWVLLMDSTYKTNKYCMPLFDIVCGHYTASYMNADEQENPFSDELPPQILKYISGWTDVIGDGHCGFRCVADMFHSDENEWALVRQHIVNEIKSYPEVYDVVYFHQREAAIHRIDYYGRFAGEHHWMELNVDLFAIANLYKCSVHLYTLMDNNVLWGCTTVLPWQTPSTIRAPRKELTIALIQRSRHFIRLHMHGDNFPVPPICNYWVNVRTESVANWPDLYARRVEDWVSATT